MQAQAAAAATPSASTHAVPGSAASRDEEITQVLAVLQGTHDGSLLSPRDLQLSDVVNHGRSALTDAARARWDEVVTLVAQGQYMKPWLHDVEHLTKDHRGS